MLALHLTTAVCGEVSFILSCRDNRTASQVKFLKLKHGVLKLTVNLIYFPEVLQIVLDEYKSLQAPLCSERLPNCIGLEEWAVV